MRKLFRDIRASELWQFLLLFIGMILLAITTAFAFTYPDRIINILGGVIALSGLISLVWGLMEETFPPLIEMTPEGIPEREIRWALTTIVQFIELISVSMLVVYALIHNWPLALGVSAIGAAIAVRQVPALCRLLIPRHYKWIAEGRVRHTHLCAEAE